MQQLLNVFVSCMTVFLAALELCMLARAFLNWFPVEEDSLFYRYIFCLTEPLILPVRAVLDRFGSFRDSPVDFSFYVTLILLSVITSVLPEVRVAA